MSSSSSSPEAHIYLTSSSDIAAPFATSSIFSESILTARTNMTKRRASASPGASRKRHASRTPSEASTNTRSTKIPDSSTGLLSPSFSESSSTLSGSSDETNDPQSTTSVENATTSACSGTTLPRPPPKSAGNSRKEAESEFLIPQEDSVMGGAACFPTPRSREVSHDGTVILPSLLSEIQPRTPTCLAPFTPQDSFPNFQAGDVVIKLGLGLMPKTFQLHSSVLKRHSTFFAHALQTDEADSEQSAWYEFALEEVYGGVHLVRQRTNGELPSIIPTDQNERVKIKTEDMDDESPCDAGPTPPSSNNSALVVHRPKYTGAIAYYTQVLGLFYSVAPQLPKSDINAALIQSEQLIKIASYLGCVHLLRAHLGNIFAQYRQALYLAIKNDPGRWIQLAIPLENTAIYTECLIHMTGAHPLWPWKTERTSLPQDLRRLITKKSNELDTMVVEAERALLLSTINVGRKPLDPTQRGQTESWLTVQIFRDLLAQCMDALEGDKKSSLKRGTFFRQLRQGKLAVLESDNVRRVCNGTMRSDWKDLSEDLASLKKQAVEIVTELAKNELMVEPDANGIGYLTCVKVREEDISWQAAGSGAV